MKEGPKVFSFGKNWQRFLKNINEESIQTAEQSLVEFLGCRNLEGRSFLDVGSGSGLFSYAAYRLGAGRVVSFDVDAFSVDCCRYHHEKAGRPQNWEIRHGSILDPEFVSRLGTFDIVYAWGVLHHTGNMWQAIRHAASRVAEGGLIYLAIYNKAGGMRGSEFWLAVKKFYNRSPKIVQWAMEGLYMAAFFFRRLVRLKNPLAEIRNYRSNRGMDWRRDITDWIGGYPYEYATAEEIFKFIKSHFPRFNLINLKTTDGVGSNWFLFENLPAEKKSFSEPHEIRAASQN